MMRSTAVFLLVTALLCCCHGHAAKQAKHKPRRHEETRQSNTTLSESHWKCLVNRTVWFFGNSVVRMWYFALQSLLTGGTIPTRKQQMRMCGRGGKRKGTRPGHPPCPGPCSCAASHKNVRLAMVWYQELEDADVREVLLGRKAVTPVEDPEHAAPVAGTRGAWVGANDVVFMQTGFDDVVSGGSWENRVRAGAPQAAGAAHQMRQNGVQVLWVLVTHVCGNGWHLTKTAVNQRVGRTNVLLSQALSAAPGPSANRSASPVPTVSLCPSRCKCPQYADEVHPGNLLAKEHVLHFLGAVCP